MSRNPVDVHVGNRLKLRRTMIGMSQDKLGQTIGLTFQQIQKYEKGTNRIGASRLYQFATVLDVPPGWFFEGLEGQPVEARNGTLLEAAPQETPPLATFSREDIELLRAFQSVTNPTLRRRVMELVRAMAAGAQEDQAA
ncbi:MAG TPA: helix-turn-helix transcriptional regulator [Ferrovibrio sp.]|uniref:helix-turn-helix domain-containing protein n=1 Tax=Ferrovibrio sp. TaxID=1917215 RepID=UPI002B4AFD39|nr:helix-turn-helix transcriptional regulator [Ferrovibrio sp.]HLT77491.1 helix-turn-helix transcriptional regulator [Ferrovibrio sp.]